MEKAISGLARMATSRKSTKDLAALDKYKEYPTDANSYELLDDCGRGVSATVHRALCKPLNDIVAIKKMNLESLNCDLEEIIHEAQTMKNYNHPNVLPLYCSFVSGQDLWMVMPFISGGSVLHIMKYAHPEGLDEVLIATIMRDVLKALEYVHKQQGIHRDIKAGNILLDKEGHVQLGDFGVAASLERTGSWGHDKVARMTFVGTPCWMAPEVMEQTQGYDSSADIWSFGISLLEMAHGHAPFAKFPPMKVLLMTLQNPPPTLDDKGKKHFSKAMRDVVTRCLQKDPRLRPTATQLLEHKFFKQAKDERYLAENLMAGLPPLGERVQDIRQGKAATNASENDRNFMRSQDEYKKGISSWNFDVAALKAQAAMEPDVDDEPALPTITEADENVDSTLSGLAASHAAQFIQAQTTGRNDGGGGGTNTSGGGSSVSFQTGSVFASLQGQQQVISSTLSQQQANISVAVPETSSGNIDVSLGGGVNDGMPPVSPGNASPAGLSRESSMQGPLNNLSTTPTGVKQKIKQQGRFQIYEPGADSPAPAHPQPSLSTTSSSMPGTAPPTQSGQPPLETSSSSRTTGAGFAPALDHLSSSRMSEDGSKRAEVVAGGGMVGQDSVFDDTLSMEPKKKGRFLVMEQQGISKASSSVNLSEAAGMDRPSMPPGLPSGPLSKSRSEAGKEPMGKPPPVPSVLAPIVPVTAVLPKLQELMEHAAAQQAALLRLVVAVQDAERGKPVPLLSRTASTKSLFSELGLPVGSGALSSLQGGANPSISGVGVLSVPSGPLRITPGSGGGDSAEGGTSGGGAGSDDVRGLVEALRARVDALEVENVRLKARNGQLEALFAGAGPTDLRSRSDGNFATDAASFSPREGMVRSATPRISDDDKGWH